ncbi:MAG: gamma-glutamylcyclotransferase [Planctomycetes bacterium]|nr:gamma-glutamylcyclotransferase [Planctomycetota bacterium]
MKYFAYGTNCNPAVLERKGIAFSDRRRASLTGYRLLFNKLALRERLPDDIGFANIEADPNGTVEGILYEISDADRVTLDESERVPDHYVRIAVTVDTEAGPVEGETYQAHPSKTALGLRPSRNYINHMLSARDFLSRQYYEALDAAQTYHGECATCHRHREVIFLSEDDRLHMLCQPCREARLTWGTARGRPLTIPETEAIMTELVLDKPGFPSIQELIRTAIASSLIDP